jgi:hypothetical protein
MIVMLFPRHKGRGRYLLNAEGGEPNSNSTFIIDTYNGTKKVFCGESASSSNRCSYVQSSSEPAKFSILSKSSSGGNQTSLVIWNEGTSSAVPPIPGCSDCEPIDFSISHDKSLLIAAMFSRNENASSVWRLSFSDGRWDKISQWYKKPGWITRPLFDSTGRRATFLELQRQNAGLTSRIAAIDLITGRVADLGIDRQIAAYSDGPDGKLAIWSEAGLEIFPEGGSPIRIAGDSILAEDDSMRPNALTWNEPDSLIAVAVTGRKTGITRIIEIDPNTGSSKVAFSEKLGRRSSLQTLNR